MHRPDAFRIMGSRSGKPTADALAQAQGGEPLPRDLAAEARMFSNGATAKEVRAWWMIFAAHTSDAAGDAAVARRLLQQETGDGAAIDGDGTPSQPQARRPASIRMDRGAFMSIPEFEFHPLGARIFDVACTFMPSVDEPEQPAMSFPQFCTLLQIFSLDGGFMEKSKLAFELIDIDGDGFIVPEEMRAYLRMISTASDDTITNATDKVFAECASKPGKISLSDFRNVVSLSDSFETNFCILPKVRSIDRILQHRVKEARQQAKTARCAAAAASSTSSKSLEKMKSDASAVDLEEGPSQLNLSGLVKAHQKLHRLAIKARTAVAKQTRTDALAPAHEVQLERK